MVFSSLTFLYGFLPLVLLSYFLCRNRAYRNGVLLLFSLLFYAWGEPRYILVLLLACFITYLTGLLIERFRPRPKMRKTVLILGLVLLLGNLFVFKYLGFFSENLHRLFPQVPQVQLILPIGISFYTFQIISYLIDLYRGHVSVQRNPLYLALYVSFFPQLIAGPIVRYQTIEDEIRNRRESPADVAAGLRRFAVGLGKKVILANNLAVLSELIYAGNPDYYGTAMYWLAAVCYALQIYFDFSGYSDMAIGLGRMFGFHFLENFNYPYISRSVTEFWRRWHISLSSWFRDYVYIPLGGNRVPRWRWALNLMIVWGLTGFWHGAMWNFLLWGLYYGLLLLLEKMFFGKYLTRLPQVVQWFYAMFLVTVGWVLFNLTDFSAMGNALTMMFTYHPTAWSKMFTTDTSVILAAVYVPIAMLCAMPLGQKFRANESAAAKAVKYLGAVVLFVLSIAMIISSSYNPFIYFRF